MKLKIMHVVGRLLGIPFKVDGIPYGARSAVDQGIDAGEDKVDLA
ncbi:hypothetical protein [Gluconobacter albidus]|uniref:Uncharacterized protein n=1 Tax=Gluconobacter albidus TaxID=318683 RepID=A0ABQ5X3E3_9PROT|nr:hypothetical protein [Gluconobacter albidus]GLQ69361.1 hypothetical protein GCM10007866_18120 [Gluconobacter albidus]